MYPIIPAFKELGISVTSQDWRLEMSRKGSQITEGPECSGEESRVILEVVSCQLVVGVLWEVSQG